MKATRKPLTDEVWQNLAPDEENHEPMPPWVKATVEFSAVAGATFMIHSERNGPRLVRPNWWIVQGPTDCYPVSPEGFEASYEPIRK